MLALALLSAAAEWARDLAPEVPTNTGRANYGPAGFSLRLLCMPRFSLLRAAVAGLNTTLAGRNEST